MKTLTLLTFVSFLLGCVATQSAKNSFSLNGVWIPTKQELGGKVLPNVVFAKQRLTVSDSIYNFVAESIDKGIIHYKDGKMDIYGKEGVNTGKHFTAIYKLENRQLSICYNLLGNGYPETFDTKGKPMFFLSIFKKE